MKKYILTFIICALSLTGCMTEESPLTSDVDIDMVAARRDSVDIVDVTAPTENTSAEISAAVTDVQQTTEEWSSIAENPDDYNEKSTATTVSLPQTAAESSDPTPADTTSEEYVNTTPANLNDPIPTMTFSCFNAAGEYEYAIQNNTPCEWGYGLEPYFDKYDEEQGVWLPVEPITEISVIEIYCILQPGGSSTYSLPLESYYGGLSAGSYRVGLLMRNHETETAEMVWFEFGVDIIECY